MEYVWKWKNREFRPPSLGEGGKIKKKNSKATKFEKSYVLFLFFSLQGFTKHISILRALIRPIVKKQIDFVYCFVILLWNSNSFQTYLMILFPLEYVFKHWGTLVFYRTHSEILIPKYLKKKKGMWSHMRERSYPLALYNHFSETFPRSWTTLEVSLFFCFILSGK